MYYLFPLNDDILTVFPFHDNIAVCSDNIWCEKIIPLRQQHQYLIPLKWQHCHMQQDDYSPQMTTSVPYSPEMTALSHEARWLFPSHDNIRNLFPWHDNIVISDEKLIPLTWQQNLFPPSHQLAFFGLTHFLRWFKCVTCSSLNDDKMTIETRKNIISIITCTLQCCLFKDVGNGIKYFIHSLHELMHSTTAPNRLIVAYSFLFSPCCCHFVAVLLVPNDDTALP